MSRLQPGRVNLVSYKSKGKDLVSPGGGGALNEHMHIRGGKSDIFGSEYCQK